MLHIVAAHFLGKKTKAWSETHPGRAVGSDSCRAGGEAEGEEQLLWSEEKDKKG